MATLKQNITYAGYDMEELYFFKKKMEFVDRLRQQNINNRQLTTKK